MITAQQAIDHYTVYGEPPKDGVWFLALCDYGWSDRTFWIVGHFEDGCCYDYRGYELDFEDKHPKLLGWLPLEQVSE